MALVIPSFDNQHLRPGVGDSGSATSFLAAGEALGNLASGAVAAQREKAQLQSMATAVEGASPDLAASFRAQASAVPLFGGIQGPGGGGGGGSRSGGSAGISGAMRDILQFGLDTQAREQDFSNRKMIDSLRHQQSLNEIGARLSASNAAASHRASLERGILNLKDRLEKAETPEEKERIEREIRLKERQATSEEIRARAAERDSQVGALETLTDLGVIGDQVQTNTNAQLSVPGVTIPARRGSSRRKDSYTSLELATHYIDSKTPETEAKRMRKRAIDHLVRTGGLDPVSDKALQAMSDDEQEDLLNRREMVADRWLKSGLNDNAGAQGTFNFNDYIDLGRD